MDPKPLISNELQPIDISLFCALHESKTVQGYLQLLVPDLVKTKRKPSNSLEDKYATSKSGKCMLGVAAPALPQLPFPETNKCSSNHQDREY